MTQKKIQTLNSRAGQTKLTKAEEKKVKRGLQDAFTVEELAAVVAGSRTNVSIMVGASIALNDINKHLDANWRLSFVNEVKSVVKTLNNPEACYTTLLSLPRFRDLLLNMYGRGIYHEEEINDTVESINEACNADPKLKAAIDEQVAIYRKQMEEARKAREAEEKK